MSTRFSFVKLFVPALALMATAGMAWSGDKPAAKPDEKPHMMYFYNPSCRLCTKTNETVGAAEEKYKKVMSSQRFNIADPKDGTDNVLYMFDLMDQLAVPEEGNVTLIVFLGLLGKDENGEAYFVPKRALIEGDRIIEKLDAEIADFLATDGKGGKTLGLSRPASFFSLSSTRALASMPPPPPAEAFSEGEQSGTDSAPSRPAIRPRVRASGDGDAPGATPKPSGRERAEAAAMERAQSQLQFGAISAAALADSVNPCAFATIIILVAMMSSAKRSRNEIIAVCLAFTVSVFLTYFAIGLFLYKIIAMINERGGTFLVVADLIYYCAFAICAVCGVLSAWDAYLLFSGRAAEEMTLQLPKAFKKRINVAMAKGVRARWLVAGVFVAGVTVSFFEAACTGQVYLPTIISLAKMDFWGSMLLLTWYNFLFVLPLLIIFGLVLIGVTSQQLADFFKKNVAWTKLALALVFVAMGAVLWFEMYWPPGYRG